MNFNFLFLFLLVQIKSLFLRNGQQGWAGAIGLGEDNLKLHFVRVYHTELGSQSYCMHVASDWSDPIVCAP